MGLGAGRRTKEWQAAWRELKPRFERAGITHCEIGYEGCTPGLYLTPAHSLKRRNISTPEELREVVIACCSCHQRLEELGHGKMAAEVRRVIAARHTPI
jgi:hypothetical protein